MDDINCPYEWSDCDLCLNKEKCIQGIFEPEEEKIDITEIAEKVEEEVKRDAKESAERIKKGVSLVQANSNEFWRWWGKSSPPDSLLQKEPTSAMSGAIERGGGSRSGKKHKVKKPTEWRPYMLP